MTAQRLADALALLAFGYGVASALGVAPATHYAGALSAGLALLALGRLLR